MVDKVLSHHTTSFTVTEFLGKVIHTDWREQVRGSLPVIIDIIQPKPEIEEDLTPKYIGWRHHWAPDTFQWISTCLATSDDVTVGQSHCMYLGVRSSSIAVNSYNCGQTIVNILETITRAHNAGYFLWICRAISRSGLPRYGNVGFQSTSPIFPMLKLKKASPVCRCGYDWSSRGTWLDPFF